MRKFWNFKSQGDERVLRLDGVISDETWLGDETTPKLFASDLNAGDGDITVWINSEGGDVFAAAEIYNMLRAYQGKVRVMIDAVAFSAASMIAMAGDTIEISPVGMIMIHNPFSIVEGDAEEMKTAAKMLDEVKESIINAYELKTKLPRARLAKMMDDETFIHAYKAIELGFADKIIGNQQSAGTTANLSSRRRILNSLRAALKKPASIKPSPPSETDVEKMRRRLYLY